MTESIRTPVIILPGFKETNLLLTDKKGAPVKSAWPPELDSDKLLSSLKGAALKMMMFRKDAGFSDKVASLVREVLDPVAAAPDGQMKHPLQVVRYPAIADCTAEEKRALGKFTPIRKFSQRIGEENVFYFSYNSFGDPYETAAELDALIEKLKAEKGCERVHILSVSMGAATVTAYFDAYGHKGDVDRVMYFAPVLGGCGAAADLLREDLQITDPGDLFSVFMDPKTGDSLREFSKMMPPGVPEAVAKKALTALRETVLFNSPGIWALLPPESYPALSGALLSDAPHAALKEKTDRFYRAHSRLAALLDEQKARGTSFYFCVGYGLPLPDLFGGNKQNADGLIDVGCATLGAKSAAPGETLPDGEIGDRAYLSPDGAVDASFGYAPDATWYFEKQAHGAIADNDSALEIAARVFCDPAFHDIHSDPALPQFGKAQEDRQPANAAGAAEEGRE